MKQLLRKSGLVALAIVLMLSFVACSKDGKKSSAVKVQVMVGMGTGTDPSQIAVHEEIQ